MKREEHAFETCRPTRIDSALIGSARLPQKYAHYDPAPHVPFEEDMRMKPITKLEWLFIVAFSVTIGYALYLAEYAK